MKAKFIKKAVAATLALALASGNLPLQFASGLFGDYAVTASAAGEGDEERPEAVSKYNAETHTLVLEGKVAYNTIAEALKECDTDEIADGSVDVVVSEEGAVLTAADALRSDEFNDKIRSIDLTGAVLEGKSARGMFSNFRKLKRVVLGNIITEEITDMSEMFSCCTSLKSIDLSGCDTKGVTETVSMFNRCVKLETVCVGSKWDLSKVEKSDSMFRSCLKICGGNGTKYDPEQIEAAYAVIDKDGNTGYLTGAYSLKLPKDMTIVEEPVQEADEKPSDEEKADKKETEEKVRVTVKYLKDESVKIGFKEDADKTQVVRANGRKLACVEDTYIVTFADERDVEITLEEFDPEAPHEHAYVEEITKEPTCTEEGEKTYTCECGDSYTEAIPALGHEFSVEWTTDIEPTCTKTGSKSQRVQWCDEKTDVTEIPVRDHSRAKAEITKEPTCTEEGEKTYTCECGYRSTEKIPALGHNFSDKWTIDVKPTCTEEGVKYHKCLRCGEKGDITKIPAKGHSWDKGEVTKSATCAENGVKTYTCTVCGETKTEVIPAHGHKYSTKWTIDEKPSCTTAGSKSHHCTLCGDKSDVTEIPAEFCDNPSFSYEVGDHAVKLSWDTVSKAQKYGIAVVVNGKWTLYEEGYGTSYVMEDLYEGKQYKIAIVAKINGVWNTADFSKAVNVTVDPFSTMRYPEVTAEIHGKRVTLKWSAVGSAEAYGVAVYQGGKWVMVSDSLSADIDSYTSTRVGTSIYKMAVCTKRKGKWDVTDIDRRAVFVNIQ